MWKNAFYLSVATYHNVFCECQSCLSIVVVVCYLTVLIAETGSIETHAALKPRKVLR